MALAPPGFCYFSTPHRLKVSNLTLGRFDVLVVMGENVGAPPFVWELEPSVIVRIPLSDAQALLKRYGGIIADRELPDTAEAEAERRLKERVFAENCQRFDAVLFHPAVRDKPSQITKALELLKTDRTAWEICRILMHNRPLLVKAA